MALQVVGCAPSAVGPRLVPQLAPLFPFEVSAVVHGRDEDGHPFRLNVGNTAGGGRVDRDTGGDARPQPPGTGPTAAGDGALSAPPLPACCAQRRRCRANPDVADHVRRRGARGRGVLQLPCRVRACCHGRAGRSASLPVVAAVARAANRGAGRAAGRAGFGAIEAAAGVSEEELRAPLPSRPAPRRRPPCARTAHRHTATRRARYERRLRDQGPLRGLLRRLIEVDTSQHDPHCSRCRQHTPASPARSPPA